MASRREYPCLYWWWSIEKMSHPKTQDAIDKWTSKSGAKVHKSNSLTEDGYHRPACGQVNGWATPIRENVTCLKCRAQDDSEAALELYRRRYKLPGWWV